MQKVITINLSGNAFQLDENACHALRAYLDHAETQLEANPDKAEIVSDLEQAIGEKCRRFLGPHKTVLALAEIEQVLREMGPVETAHGSEADDAAAREARAKAKAEADAGAPKRLYRIREGGMIGGICNGIGAYLGIDPNIVRVVFILLTLMTHWVWLLVYIVLMFVLPIANTSEEHAAAQGLAFTAQELVDSAKRNYSEFKDKHWKDKQWKWQRRQQRREWKRQQRMGAAPQAWQQPPVPEHVGYSTQLLRGIFVPIFGIVNAALSIALLIAIISILDNGSVLGWPLPAGVPTWAGILILVAVYQIVMAPFRMIRYALYHSAYGNPWAEVWGGVFWMAFAIFFFWMAYQHLPEVRDFLQQLDGIDYQWRQRVQAALSLKP